MNMKKIIAITYVLLFTLCVSAQILVIPDVHGRTFWKEAVAKHLSLPVVFLGDYLDPYAREHITPDEALANFKDIIAFKQANKDRVTLLIGNHEIHYLDSFYHFSRKDTLHADDIHQLLVDHLSLFSMASRAEVNGKAILFTHAGIVEPWWKKHFSDTPTDIVSVCNALNAKMKDIETLGAFIDDALMDITKRRGGDSEAGSCLWADLDEHKKSNPFSGIYQVFGHTQQKKKAVIKKGFADLDCRKAFIVTPSGKILVDTDF